MAALKYSRQREAIKEFLDNRTDHPTADTVYENIREQYPNISLGTVYRNLALLVSIGEINKISSAQGPDRFDARTSPHHHFVCRNCHEVIDLDMKDPVNLEERASANFEGIIEGHTISFFGLCERCKNTEKKSLTG